MSLPAIGATKSGSGWPPVAGDVVALAVLTLLSLGTGTLLNLARPNGLPIQYQTREQRLQAAMEKLPPGQPANVPIERIALGEFQPFVQDKVGLVLDARPAVFYTLGHVPGALNLARESFAQDYTRLRTRLEASREIPIVVYCSDADCPDSGLVADALRKLGYRRLAEFHDGWDGWTAAGLPEEKQAHP